MIFFHKIFSGTNTFFVLHSSPPTPQPTSHPTPHPTPFQPPPNPLMVSNGPLPLYREQDKGIPLQYYRSRVLNDPCNWDVFGVRGSGLGIMKTQGRIVLGLLLQEPFVKRFVYQPNKRIYECFCFCCFFFPQKMTRFPWSRVSPTMNHLSRLKSRSCPQISFGSA